MKLRNIAGKKSIITKSYAGNEGKIVTCIRLATREELILERFNLYRGPVWWVDSYIPCDDGTFCNLAIDAWMTLFKT